MLHQQEIAIDNWVGIIGSLVMIIAGLYALVDIVLIKKRYEKFLIGTTMAFFLYGVFGLPFYFLVIYSSESWPYVYLLVLSIFFFQLAHTLFTVQYL